MRSLAVSRDKHAGSEETEKAEEKWYHSGIEPPIAVSHGRNTSLRCGDEKELRGPWTRNARPRGADTMPA